MDKNIAIFGARHHNLKDLDLEIPRDQLVVVCGPSGSGKSTLAFDIIYAEGQRRYVESLSTYARQFLPQLDKPKVDKVEGLSPSISLSQHTTGHNPRSTVGTSTEIYDFLRIFFARLGLPHCPKCGKPIKAQTSDEIIDAILALPEGSKFLVLAPLVENKKGTQADLLNRLKGQGFVRVRIDGQVQPLDPLPELEKNKRHCLEVVVDRLVMKEGLRKRLADSVELALQTGQGQLILKVLDDKEKLYSTQAVCPDCSLSLQRPTPQLFSFNSPQGACPTCSGLGSIEYFEPHLLAPNKGLSLSQGGVIPWRRPRVLARFEPELERLGRHYGFDLDTSLSAFSDQAWQALFYGDEQTDWPGIISQLEAGMGLGRFWRDEMSRFRQSKPCPACQGSRLKPEALSVLVQGTSIQECTSWSISQLTTWIQGLGFAESQKAIVEPLRQELLHRLHFLSSVGLDYLNLARNIPSLSAGEAQRIRLAGQLGSGLVGVTYVLDEPSIGLHPRDNARLIKSMRQLQGRGNTVLVVEHDRPTIEAADHILELGPGSGIKGGELIYSGDINGLLQTKGSLTGKYLRGELAISPPARRRSPNSYLHLWGVQTNNLKDLDCQLPLGCLICVTGVSGSGKSSLVIDSLYKHLALAKGLKVDNPGRIAGLSGDREVQRVIRIDQSPIGRTPRSNPATYTKVFDEIRKIFASTPEAKKRGYRPGRFSFNVRGGRCEACRGDGQIRVEMHFLPDVFVTCEVCSGKRYNQETLEVRYKGLDISQVLDLSVSQAREIFGNYPVLERKLGVLEEVGLDYLALGQPATTLSGGEAQRLKISRELGKRSLPGALYILDEPTTGLHMHEVGMLIQVLHRLVDKGASVMVIEHNTDIIKAADQVIDLGPGGGVYGGQIVASGTPEQIRDNPDSVTGEFLADLRPD